jgi:hypothetical protein
MKRKMWKFLNRFGWLITAISIGYLSLSLVGDLSGESIPDMLRNPTLRLTTYLISILFIGWKAWLYEQKYNDLLETQPNIITTGFDKENVPTTTKTLITRKPKKEKHASGGIRISGRQSFEQSSSGGTILAITDFAHISEPNLEKEFVPGDNYERYYVVFRNEKHGEKGLDDAENVHAQFTFFDQEMNHLYSHELPRWRNTLPPHEFDGEVTISSSRKPEQLCLVIRKEGSEELFIFSDDSYVDASFEPLQEEYKLRGSKHYIRVQMSAKNMERKTFWISMINRGKNKDPDFDLVDPPLN